MYLAGDDRLHAWGLSRRRRVTVGNHLVWVAPPEYVVLRKLEYARDGGSDKHLGDVAAVLRVLGDTIDRGLLAREVDRLDVRAQWESALTRLQEPTT